MSKLSQKENLLNTIKNIGASYTPFGMEATIELFHKDALFYDGNGDMEAMEWTDAWGVQFKISDPSFRKTEYPVYHPLHDYSEMGDFPFPSPYKIGLMDDVINQASLINRDEKLIMVSNPGCMFVRSWLLRGMENLLMDLILEPEKVEELLDIIVDYQIKIAKEYVKIKPDIALVADDAGTTKALMMNPVLWRQLIKPRLKKVIDIYKDAGCIILFHCCGHIMDIIDDIMEIGVDILNPLQAGANDLAYIRERTQEQISLYGGIDAHTVMTGTPEAVYALTTDVLNILAKNGRYIAYPDQGLPYPEENLHALKKAVHDFDSKNRK